MDSLVHAFHWMNFPGLINTALLGVCIIVAAKVIKGNEDAL